MAKVGMVNLNKIRHEANSQIEDAIHNSWLDPDTVRDFLRRKKNLQSRPFALQDLYKSILHEIKVRKELYGRG